MRVRSPPNTAPAEDDNTAPAGRGKRLEIPAGKSASEEDVIALLAAQAARPKVEPKPRGRPRKKVSATPAGASEPAVPNPGPSTSAEATRGRPRKKISQTPAGASEPSTSAAATGRTTRSGRRKRSVSPADAPQLKKSKSKKIDETYNM